MEWVIGAVLIVLGAALLLSGISGNSKAFISAITGSTSSSSTSSGATSASGSSGAVSPSATLGSVGSSVDSISLAPF